jgi:hypothetical protein
VTYEPFVGEANAMSKFKDQLGSGFDDEAGPPEFDMQDGLALALAYLEDPSNVPCPHCGPNTIEVVAFLDASSMERGAAVPTKPEGDYTVVLYCHSCGRAAALDLSRDDGTEDRNAA